MARSSASRPAVLHVECATTFGGSVRTLENFLRHRRDAAFRHVVVLYHASASTPALAEAADALHILPPARPPSWRPRLVKAIASTAASVRWLHGLIRSEDVHLVKLNNSPVSHRAAVIAARLAGVPCVAFLRSFPQQRGRFERRWRSALSGYVAMSHAIRDAYLEEVLFPRHVEVIYDGTPAHVEPPRRPDLEAPFRIGSLGRLVAWKGLIDLVQAARIVLDAHPRAAFEIMGNEDPAEPGFKRRLLAEIERLGVGDQVRLRDFDPDPTPFLRSLDVLANPSFPAEPFGMSLVEAMALGCPVVATAGGGPGEIVEHGRSGLLVPPNDPPALAGALLSLMRDRDGAAGMRVEARQRVRSRFDVERQTAAQEAFLAGAAGGATRTKPAVLHLEAATSYGGSVRSLQNFLKARRDPTFRHLVGLYTPLPERLGLSEACDGLWTTPRRPDGDTRLARTLRLVWWLVRLMRSENVRLVRLNNSPTMHTAAVLAARLAQVPCVAWLRSFPAATDALPDWRLRWPTRLVANSESVRRAHLDQGLPPERILTIHNGVELARLDDARPSSATFRVGTLGRLVAWKGLLDFVRAAAHVRQRRSDVRFEIAGNDDGTEPDFKRVLRAEIERLALGDVVTLHDFVADPRPYLSSLDCLCNPSTPAEPFGNSIVEAMALGRPVVATRGGGPSEIIEDGISGVLVPASSPSTLAAAILRLAEDAEGRRRLGAAARRRVEERFELAGLVARQEALFRETVAAAGGL